MKRIAFLLIFILSIQNVFANTVSTFSSENGKFGLKDSSGNIILDAKYKKLVHLGEKSWIVQDGTKFGIVSNDGEFMVEPKYTQAERVLGKFVKFGKGDKYGIFDEMGFDILPVEYSSIDLLYGGMFVTSKNYMYGISDLNGQIILDNIFDDIYMPDFNTLVLIYNGEVYKVEREKGEQMQVPFDIQSIHQNVSEVTLEDIAENPIYSTGYYSVTATDYVLKIISSISPAYEQTIDELMYSQGADTVNVIMKLSWLPKFPFVYAKKYYRTFANPYSGPLSKVKKNIKRRIKN